MTSPAPVAEGTVYERLGVKPVINARGNNTTLGGSTPSPRVRQAMLDTERYYVNMQQLLERSGEIIADLLGCEAAYVTPGAAAALALGTAACMTGNDADKLARLPDTTGMANTVLIQAKQRYHYEHAVAVPGARLVEVGDANGTTAAQLDAALGPHVAAVMVVAHLEGVPGALSLREVLDIAHARGIPVLVDAAGRVYPLESFRAYAQGADLVAFGAKYFGALNGSGILCGKRDMVAAAVPHGFIGFETVAWGKSFGRPLKLDRQTIVAVVTALQEWFELDHAARLEGYERRLNAIAETIHGLPGVTQRMVHGDGPEPRMLRLTIDSARARTDAAGALKAMLAGTPAIAVDDEGEDWIAINPVTLRPEDDALVASRLREVLG